ncbi:hypothetical protein BE221DRAFT_192408 [Ostreococcus tauri]|uniref:Uncharacterized protein n=1 Tax=Ostreococcus tauri TaxID=70448 RepID=A0A1Y5ICP4_OSTTA|nr:hypothetical protein BE221DRAFT_192408 [Ostreococcus tauri]
MSSVSRVAAARAVSALIASTTTRACAATPSPYHRAHTRSVVVSVNARRRGDGIKTRAGNELGRERAADLASGSDFGRGDESDDPLVHMGRVNKSALKRIAQDQRALAVALLGLPKSQVTQMRRFLPEDVVELTLQGAQITRKKRVAFKRHEGALARRLRALNDGERDALAAAIQQIQTGTSGAINPNVENTATSWRNMLLKGSEDDALAARDEIFAALDSRDVWSFTRQELMRAVSDATTENAIREEQIALFKSAVDEEMKLLSIGIEDEESLNQTRAYAANTLKNRKGSGFDKEPSVTKSRALLKLLRIVAEAAV